MTFIKTNRRTGERAFTLTELAIVMGVIGVILGAVWFAASNASELQKDNNAVNELQAIVQNMNNTMKGQSFRSLSTITNITTNMITQSMVIPSSFVDIIHPHTADNPWSLGSTTGSSYTGLIMWGYSQSATTYRVSFYNTSYKGCMALLLQGTACQAGQIGCPIAVWTGGVNKVMPATSVCIPNQNNCPSASPSLTTGLGWQAMTVNVAATMCGPGTNPANGGSVEFDYSL